MKQGDTKKREVQELSVPPEQTLRLVRAFTAIRDHQDRELLISFLESIAEEREPAPGALRHMMTTRH